MLARSIYHQHCSNYARLNQFGGEVCWEKAQVSLLCVVMPSNCECFEFGWMCNDSGANWDHAG